MCVLHFECCGEPLIAGFLSDRLRLLDQENRRVRLGDKKDSEDEAETGKYSKDPEDPAPRYPRHLDVSTYDWTERWTCKRRYNEN